MKLLESLSAAFNTMLQKHADKKELKNKLPHVESVIASNDAKAVKASIEEISSLSSYNTDVRDRLMRKAITGDHENSFHVLMEEIADPNYMLTEVVDMIPDRGYEYESKSLLYTAVEAQSPKIASILANDPKIDVTKSGFHKSNIYGAKKEIDFKTPLETARGVKSLSGVISVLARKEAEMKMHEAALLYSEANHYWP